MAEAKTGVYWKWQKGNATAVGSPSAFVSLPESARTVDSPYAFANVPESRGDYQAAFAALKIQKRMRPLQITVPDPVLERAKELAQKHGVTMDEFFTIAVTERVAEITASNYLRACFEQGKFEEFRAFYAEIAETEGEGPNRLESKVPAALKRRGLLE